MSEVNKIYEKTLSLLSSDDSGELKELLKRILDWEIKNPPTNEFHGFYWHEVYGDPRVLNKLVVNGILKVVLRTNSGTAYRVIDKKAIEQAITDLDKAVVEAPRETTIPENILDLVVGHEEKKEIITRVLKSKERVHILLYGSPASAKSLILECLSRGLPNSKLILGSSSTKAGLFDLLYNEEPDFLVIDEIDKMENPEDLSILLSLMQSGKISETKYGRRRSKVLNTKVVAAANRIDKIPPELLSRFIKLRFKDYTDDEFVDVAAKVLTSMEGLPIGLAVYIADQTLKKLRTRDVRQAVYAARILNEQTRKDVDRVIELLSKQV